MCTETHESSYSLAIEFVGKLVRRILVRNFARSLIRPSKSRLEYMHKRTYARDRIFPQKTYKSMKRRTVSKQANSISIIESRDKNKELAGNFFADHQQYFCRTFSIFLQQLRRKARQKCNLLYFNRITIRK